MNGHLSFTNCWLPPWLEAGGLHAMTGTTTSDLKNGVAVDEAGPREYMSNRLASRRL